ncbi:glutamate receptor ionotropic, kainate 2-like isoform X2 [Danaus plexippus]|uniref:glutamate receptor ionotropic, kainate 2-like isoform X2 n=1 Tax=Danaus plexippus TaxID=13037 RepID=UPI002AB22A27|nr:glutamate receptor ionotropic, kainate 2-like isoform X2 [Danaus plexippus]
MISVENVVFSIEIILQLLIDKYLISSSCMTLISEGPLKLKFNNSLIHFYNNDTEELFNMMLEASQMGCSDYIVQMDDPQSFMMNFDKVIHMGNVRRSDRKIVMIPSTKLPLNDSNYELLKVLSMKETSFVANILLVLPQFGRFENQCEKYDLVTHQFVGRDNNDLPVYLDVWDSCTLQFAYNVDLFPHNMLNLYGKVVTVAAFTYKPYVILDIDKSIVPQGQDGIDVRIVEEFCRWINCTIEIIREDEEEWGEIYANQTGIGVLGSVFEDRADLGITALYSWYEEYVEMDFSAPYIRTGITCIAPSPRLLASWTMPLLPFSLYMWIGIFFTFLYSSLALSIARGFKLDKVFFTTFAILITQSVSSTFFQPWRIRSVLGWMMITGLVLDNAYGGGLASTFTVPKYEPTVDTIRDMVDRKLEWGATHTAWTFSLTLSQEPLIKQLISQFKTYSAEELVEKSFTRNLAFSIEILPAGYFAIGEYITKEASLDLTIMLEQFYFEQCVIMMRKSSVFTDKINKLIGRLHESGLLLAWETQIALQHLDYEVQLEVKLSRSKRDVENIEPLAIRHVVGIFIIYGIGVTISFVVFLAEITCCKKKVQ